MKKSLLIGLLLLCSCVGDNRFDDYLNRPDRFSRDNPKDNIVGLSPITDDISLIGRTWLYDRTLSLPGIIENTPTIQAYSYMSCERDTIIQGKQYFVLNEEYLVRGQIDTYRLNAHFFVHLGNDSVIILSTDTTSYSRPVVGLYKKAAEQRTFQTTDNIRDKYAVLLVPFSDTLSWYLKPVDSIGFNVKRQYLGTEIISVPAGTFECQKIAMYWSDAGIESFDSNQIDWVSTYGLVQSKVDDGVIPQVNSWGDSIASVGFLITTKLLSTSSDIPANVGPMLPPNLIDTLKRTINENWKISHYKAWLDKHIETNNITNMYELKWTANVNSSDILTTLLQSIWGDSLVELPEMLSAFSRPFPSDSIGFHNYNAFISTVACSYELMPGWVDCDLNVAAGETSRTTPPFRFGNSAIRTRMMATLYK